ncbi:proline racemase family protein [Acinetobacter lactucae]|uniref:proline racemase family protein n=1 Tax=Acinetobacter lactucae TaxID=1785128 RepID=UPI0015F540F1|nr:proline racemase family protein [Acinetobacter lactucae]MDV7473218.1 proline racemase family protein [Acinetobacter baumannii]
MNAESLKYIDSFNGLIEVIDVHVGGDLHRIVVDGVKELQGTTVLQKMQYLKEHADGLRQVLLYEPRGGHPSLYADLVVPPTSAQADAGFIIMELMGYPLISGTNTMSTAIALLETGRLPMKQGITPLTLEAPGGLIKVEAECDQGKVKSITYEASTPSYVAEKDLKVEIDGFGWITFDIVWTGAFYPIIDASSLGFELVQEEEEALVSFARKFITVVRDKFHPIHPVFGDEGPLSFVVFASSLSQFSQEDRECRVCCYEYPRKSVCRAPAGVPSTAVLARLVSRGLLELGERVRTVSIFGTDLKATVKSVSKYHEYDGYIVSVKGSGWITARSTLVINSDDPLTPNDGLDAVLK